MFDAMAKMFVAAGAKPEGEVVKIVTADLIYKAGAKREAWPDRVRLHLPPESVVPKIAVDFISGKDPCLAILNYCLAEESDLSFPDGLDLLCLLDLKNEAFRLVMQGGLFCKALGVSPLPPSTSVTE